MAGQCFEKSGKAIVEGVPTVLAVSLGQMGIIGGAAESVCDPGRWRLCHGIVTGTGGPVEGKKYAHAWVENDLFAFDADSGRLMFKALYYAAGNVEQVERYTQEEARRMTMLTEHWGPWADRFYSDDLESLRKAEA